MMLGSRPSGLGRGLGAIIPPKQQTAAPAVRIDTVAEEPSEGERPIVALSQSSVDVRDLPIHLVDPNPHQPRQLFEHGGMEDLVASIKEHGVMQPIVVTPKTDGRFELIAGERRLRASKIAGLEKIPAIVRTATEQQKLELAIIENVQRRDLNPLEEARAYIRLQEEFNLTQDQIGERVGKSRPQVGNIMRLVQLPAEIQEALEQGRISMSNARTLLSLPTESQRMELFRAMLEGNFTVRQTEARVPHPRTRQMALTVDPNITFAENQLREKFGTKVAIKRDVRGEGEIKLSFLDEEDLNSILNKLLGV